MPNRPHSWPCFLSGTGLTFEINFQSLTEMFGKVAKPANDSELYDYVAPKFEVVSSH